MRITVRANFHLKEALGARQIEIVLPVGTTLTGLLSRMVETWGDKLTPQVFEPNSKLIHSYIRLLVNGQGIEFLHGTETTLSEGDEVLLLFPVSGG